MKQSFAKRVATLFKCNWKTAILFELLYRLILTVVIVPLMGLFMDVAMYGSGNSYLIMENIVSFLDKPLTWLVLFCMLLIIAFFAFYEICALVLLAEASREGRKLGLLDMNRLALRQSKRVFKRGYILFMLFALLLSQLSNLALFSGFVAKAHVPEFIADYIMDNTLLSLVALAAIVYLFVTVFFMIFTVHNFSLYNMRFKDARRASRKLIKKKKWYVFSRLAVWWVIIWVLMFLLGLLDAQIINSVSLQANEVNATSAGGIVAIMSIIDVFYVVLASLVVPISYDILSEMFYELLGQKSMEMPPRLDLSWLDEDRKLTRKQRLPVMFMGIFAAVLVAFFALNVVQNSVIMNSGSDYDFELLAHRGASTAAPENTLEAFQAAINQYADWVELDVRQTADGILVVSHDENLKRTCGVDVNICDVNYDDIKDFDHGSWFSPEFASSRVCTLEEALQLCEGKVKMNIELKPDSKSHGMEQQTIELIKANGMTDESAIACLDYAVLDTVKEIDPDIKTIFNMTIAYGEISQLDAVDIYSVDEACITSKLVKDVHNSGKVIYAWTVNDTSNMQNMVSLGVDGMLTDDVRVASEELFDTPASTFQQSPGNDIANIVNTQ